MSDQAPQHQGMESLLEGLGRRARRLRRGELLAVGGGAVGATWALALLLAQWGLTRTGLFLLVAALVGFGLLAWRLFATTGRRGAVRALHDTAYLVERLAPELGSAPSSAVEFLGRMREVDPDLPFSADLARAHIDHTGTRLSGLDLGGRLEDSERRRQRQSMGAGGGGALLFLLALWALGDGRDRLWMSIVDPGAARFSDVPLVGDIRLTYRYPAYTGEGARVVEGGDGSINAVVGTEVDLEAVADGEVSEARLVVLDGAGAVQSEIPLRVEEGRKVKGTLPVKVDGRYRFALLDGGDRLEERQGHSIRAQLDAHPEVTLDRPATDVELKDDQVVDVLWRSRDDFGVQEIHLVVEPEVSGAAGPPQPIRIPLGNRDGTEKRREGRYRWSVAELGLAPGTEARFFLEVQDNDTISGPKKATSAARRLVLFSARKNHDALLERERQLLDRLVDWLGDELVNPVDTKASGAAREGVLTRQQALVDHMAETVKLVAEVVALLRDDQLSKPEVATAFSNVREHIERSRAERAGQIIAARRGELRGLANVQRQAIDRLERDIIYLDDLLALQRIDSLKQTAKELLSAQRDLQSLLQQYKESKDPALRAALEEKIRALREQMLELLARMASIKKQLPGEYRNMESASALQMDDQLQQIEKALREGDLDGAAKELEQLANAIENMVDSINSAEEEFGGERYDEMRKELNEFAEQFKALEAQQEQLAQKSEELLKEYRKKAIEETGKNLDSVVKKARDKVAQALRDLDKVGEAELRYSGDQEKVGTVRQRLTDLDALLEQRDLATARDVAFQASDEAQQLQERLEISRAFAEDSPNSQAAQQGAAGARAKAEEVGDLLDKLFPDPSEVMSREEMAQLQRMAQKQKALREQAGALGERMDQMAEELPLFGGEPRESLRNAGEQMMEAGENMQGRRLPGAAGHGRRAADHLKSLRQALEQAGSRGGGGLPLPLGGGQGGQRQGPGNESKQEDVEIPPEDPNRAGLELRKELLDAAKQKAPENYEEAVRRYYQELIK